MKDSSKILWSMGKELKNLAVKIFIKGNILKENLRGMVNIFGKMEVFIKEIFWEDSVKEMGSGKRHQEIVINIKDNI